MQVRAEEFAYGVDGPGVAVRGHAGAKACGLQRTFVDEHALQPISHIGLLPRTAVDRFGDELIGYARGDDRGPVRLLRSCISVLMPTFHPGLSGPRRAESGTTTSVRKTSLNSASPVI